jgi:hypothetical protein
VSPSYREYLLFSEGGNFGELADVEDYARRLLRAMFRHEGLKAGGAAANGCNFDALGDEVIGHCGTDTGGCADNEDVFVWEGHRVDFVVVGSRKKDRFECDFCDVM